MHIAHLLSSPLNAATKAYKMGRNGLMGNFQGFDAFGKVCYNAADTLRLKLMNRQWKMSRSVRGPAHCVSRSNLHRANNQ
jgi:hypothetical protein